MTSQKDQIQSLINDIERALSAQRSNKPWVRASDVEPQREALARAQDYLRSLQQTFEAPGGWGPVDPSTGQIAESEGAIAQNSPEGVSEASSQGNRPRSERFGQFSGQSVSVQPADADGQSADSVLQALLTEMRYLKSSALEPLRLEMDELRQKRDRLQQEVESLDQQRESSLVPTDGSAVSEAQLNDFLTALMGRLQENLTAQVGQTLGQLEADHAEAIAKLAAADDEVLQLRGSGQIEELRQLQGRSDQLLVNIDSTLQRMFETLQQNINSYQLSLNEGIENMHSLGRQGEVIVRSLVDHLTQQLGQTTPPEPAFFPTRSAAVPLVLVDEERDSFGETEATDDSMSDTVSSLNEILPDLTSDPEVAEPDFDSLSDVEAREETQPDADSAVQSDVQSDVQPEDCIREDGTIDLDLLKLDIDREEGDAIAPEDVMVDAALADAQVAATESEDPEIEAKVTPTAESLYLADLTFDDLTADPNPTFELAENESPAAESPAADEPAVDEPAVDEQADVSEEPTEAPVAEESADVGARTAEQEMPESSLVPDIPDTEDDPLIDSLPLPGESDDQLSEDLAAELASVSHEAEIAATESIDGNLDALTSDLEEAVLFEEEVPTPDLLPETADPLDSAQIPDQPHDEEASDALHSSLADIEALETDASETGASETDAPGDLVNTADAAIVPTEDAPLSPTDFDDDLDFYRAESDDSATEDVVTEDAVTEDAVTEDAVTENAIVDSAVATPLLEPPFSGATSPTPAVAEPIDPFATADLERLPDEGLPLDPDETVPDDSRWFLGVDVGTTGLSAVLINQLGDQVYPLCWNTAGDESERFRLPAIAQMAGQDRAQPGFGNQIGEVGIAALQSDDNKLLRHIKPLLKVGIPHGSSGEPWVQWSEQTAMPLQEVQSALSELLKSLNATRASCRAIGLDDSVLRRVLANLTGVVVGYPTNWPDTYSLNIREAVLSAGLVERGEQVFFVEEVIAALLSALPDPKMDSADIDDQQPGLYNCEWSGGTIVLSAGATLTEAAVANLPEDLEQLSYGDFAMRSFGYAGDSLDQDIICQLLQAAVASTEVKGGDDAVAEDESWFGLGLNNLTLPQPGEADRAKRYRLRQRLNSSALGRRAIAVAQQLKIDLQEAAQSEVTLGDRTWTVKRKDLETKVFLPYIQRINRQINALLSQSDMSAEAVKQVVCTGGSASLSAIARWLRQKFPNATIIQDTYSGEYSNSCSRVAYGLANMCNYPHVLDSNRHQYSDYFLLLELLRILPDQPLPAGGILHLLEQRGIDTRACQSHILALIEGHLPPGFVPIESDRPLISAQSPDIPTYEAISELPLFRKQGGQIYIADAEQGERLRQHLENILAGKAQMLNEPQSLQLAAETV